MRFYEQRLDKYSRPIKFLVTGGSAALIEYLVFVVLHKIDANIIVANSLSFICGLFVSFMLNKLWVFRARNDAGLQFGMYFILAFINLIISDSLIWLGVNELSIHPMIAKIITMASIALWNYVVYSKIIFIDRSNSKSN